MGGHSWILIGTCETKEDVQSKEDVGQMSLEDSVKKGSDLHVAWSGKDYESNKQAIEEAIESIPDWGAEIRVIEHNGSPIENMVTNRVNVWLDEAGAVWKFDVW